MTELLIYGSYGYTGELIVERCLALGLRPALAGRSEERLRAQAADTGLSWRTFSLENPVVAAEALHGVRAVLHCAGPFSRTASPMAEACLRARAHYLDITGEIDVFEHMAGRDAEAKAKGVMLMPGCGFDVVPTDCLAAHLRTRLPGAARLTLGFSGSGRPSQGTAKTMAEQMPRGGMIRKDGRLTPVPAAWKTRRIDFGRGPETAITIPWGDVSTAYHTTGIPDIEVYMAAPAGMRMAARLSRHFSGLLARPGVQDFFRRRIEAGPPGPSPERRSRGNSLIWGEAESPEGARAVSRMRTPEGYTLTALTATAIAQRALAGDAPPGFQTPAGAYGKDFILEFDGVTRKDDEEPGEA